MIFSYQTKSNISGRKRATSILPKMLYSHFKWSLQCSQENIGWNFVSYNYYFTTPVSRFRVLYDNNQCPCSKQSFQETPPSYHCSVHITSISYKNWMTCISCPADTPWYNSSKYSCVWNVFPERAWWRVDDVISSWNPCCRLTPGAGCTKDVHVADYATVPEDYNQNFDVSLRWEVSSQQRAFSDKSLPSLTKGLPR